MKNKYVLLALASAVSAGCDDSVTGGQFTVGGRVDAYVIDTPASGQNYRGTIASNANVAVSADGQTWIELGSPNGITINLQSRDSTSVHGEQDLRAGTYAHVRLTLRNAAAMLRAGATIGSVNLTSDTQLALGGSDREIVIQKQVTPFTVTGSSRHAISFELNSEMWVTGQNAQDRTVDDAEVSSAATVVVRQR